MCMDTESRLDSHDEQISDLVSKVDNLMETVRVQDTIIRALLFDLYTRTGCSAEDVLRLRVPELLKLDMRQHLDEGTYGSFTSIREHTVHFDPHHPFLHWGHYRDEVPRDVLSGPQFSIETAPRPKD